MFSMLEMKRWVSRATIKKRDGKWAVCIFVDPFHYTDFDTFEEAAAHARGIWLKITAPINAP